MKYLNIYTSIKHFITSRLDRSHYLLAKSDDWVESQNHDILAMWFGVVVAICLFLIIVLSWLIMKSEDTPNERNNR